MKKRLTALLLALGLALGLCGCGGRRSYTTDKLRVWIWDESQKSALEALAAPWAEKAHVEVEIYATDQSAYWKDAATGLLPDLMWVDDAHLPELAESLLPLDETFKSNRKLGYGDFPEAIRTALTWQGSAYALPVQGETWALWYNRAIFDSVQQAYPDETWTWSQVEQAAALMTNRNSGCYGIVIPCKDVTAWYQVIYAFGGRVLGTSEAGKTVSGWTDEATVEAMNLLGRMVANAMPSQTAMDQMGVFRLFANGSAGMALLSRSDGQTLIQKAGAGQWACTLLPYVDWNGDGECSDGERVGITGATGWAVTNRSTDANAALELMEVLGGRQARSADATQEPTAEGETVTQDPLAAYDRMETEAVLLQRPVEDTGEDWEDYACTLTMYTAWNDPTQMEEMLKLQHSYTQSQLDKRSEGEESTES